MMYVDLCYELLIPKFYILGKELKKIREEKNLSIEDVSYESGINEMLLKLIEEGYGMQITNIQLLVCFYNKKLIIKIE